LPHTDIVVHLEPRREGLNVRDRALAVAVAEPLVRDVHDISIYNLGGRKSVSLPLKMQPYVGRGVAHEVGERVEARLREEPDVEDVHTHLEPLEQPVAAHDETMPSDDSEKAAHHESRGRPDR
jgi:divalent metal cation (Fe/Co/Zn/Cd) transporter